MLCEDLFLYLSFFSYSCVALNLNFSIFKLKAFLTEFL